MRHAKPPALLIIGGNVGYGSGLLRQRVEVILQFIEVDLFVYGSRITNDVQVVFPEIDDFTACFIKYIGIPDIPFPWHNPVENLGSSRHLVYVQRNVALQHT